jgi:hypothetical protein
MDHPSASVCQRVSDYAMYIIAFTVITVKANNVNSHAAVEVPFPQVTGLPSELSWDRVMIAN